MIYAGIAVAYMLVPIAVIAVFSFGETPRDRLNFSLDGGFTLEYWTSVFSISELNDAMILSLELAALTTLIATVIGTLMALALVRHSFFGRRGANLLIVLPMATPEVVIGAALLSLFVIYGLALGFTTLLIAHVMFSISFVVVVVRSRLIGFDRSIEEAAADLGATPLQTFRYVTLPLLAPGVMAAGLLAFALSIDDFVISNFNSGTTVTFPLYVYGAALRGIPIQVNVFATLLFALTVAAIALTIWQQRRAEQMAAVRPEQEEEPFARAPAPGVAGG
jgi:spermidine/putrescine transport system permease protein